jgi:hypothetical protein
VSEARESECVKMYLLVLLSSPSLFFCVHNSVIFSDAASWSTNWPNSTEEKVKETNLKKKLEYFPRFFLSKLYEKLRIRVFQRKLTLLSFWL